MPTFKIFQNGSCIQTIQGADATALSQAVAKAVQLAGAAKSPEAVFKTPGRTLGGERGAASRSGFHFDKLLRMLISFVGLYFVSFFSFDGQKAAEQSQFNIHNTQQRQSSTTYTAPFGSGSGSGARPSGSSTRPQQKAAFKTLADL